MKKIFLTLVAISISILTFSQGVIWNDAIAKGFAESATRLEATRATFPISYSLERYVPQVYDQGETNMCVAYALSVSRTILYAKYHDYISTKKIKENSFSPYFIYYHTVKMKDDKCILGLSPTSTTDFMEKSGVARIMNVEYPKYYPYSTVRLCGGYPDNYNNDVSSAKAYTIDGINWPTDKNQIKSEIANGRPVCFSIPSDIPPSFNEPKSDVWDPDASVQCYGVTQKGYACKRRSTKDIYCYQHKKETSNMGHMMLIIGYNDDKANGNGAFRILNSWGEEWGDNGKIWIKYNDFFKYVSKFGGNESWANDPLAFSIHRRYEYIGNPFVE
jgi:C1A family cysteine protease